MKSLLRLGIFNLCTLIMVPALANPHGRNRQNLAAPANNTCATAQTISNGIINGTNVGATQSMEPGNCYGSPSSSAHDVWFKFTAYNFGNAVLELKPGQAGFNPVIELYTGSCGALSYVDCRNDDAAGESEFLYPALTKGLTYYVRVYGWQGTENSFQLSLCLDSLSLTSTAAAFCSGVSSSTITVQGGGSNYNWYQDGNLISSQTSATYVTTTPGLFTVDREVGGCYSTSNELLIAGPMIAPGLGGTGVYGDNSAVNVGIPQTEPTQDYAWRKAGIRVFGPFSGNGSNQSFNFPMTSGDAGQYRVVSTRPGCDTVYSNDVFLYYGGVKDLQLNSCPYTSANFSWQVFNNPVQRFEYAITDSNNPPDGGTQTSANTATVNGLQPNTQYYLHVRGGNIPSLDISYLSFYDSDWKTLAFITSNSPVAANSTEWTGNADTNWNNSGNWICGIIPNSGYNVFIPSGRSRYPLVTQNISVKTLSVQAGASCTVAAGIVVTVSQ